MEGFLSREPTIEEPSKSSKKASRTKLKANLIKKILPSEVELSALCAMANNSQYILMAKSVLSEEPNLVSLSAPATFIGNLHGQYEDLLHLLNQTGLPPHRNLIFLGGYVNRGAKGLETILHILALKVEFPSRVQLFRGNHDCRSIMQNYGFYDECCKKYGTLNVYNDLTDLFDYFPLAGILKHSVLKSQPAWYSHSNLLPHTEYESHHSSGGILENRVFVVHGGLSPHLLLAPDLQKIDRHREIPKEGAFCDLMWRHTPTDPDDALKYASMFWGFVMTSAVSVLALRKFSTPKKAAVFYGTNTLRGRNQTNSPLFRHTRC